LPGKSDVIVSQLAGPESYVRVRGGVRNPRISAANPSRKTDHNR